MPSFTLYCVLNQIETCQSSLPVTDEAWSKGKRLVSYPAISSDDFDVTMLAYDLVMIYRSARKGHRVTLESMDKQGYLGDTKSDLLHLHPSHVCRCTICESRVESARPACFSGLAAIAEEEVHGRNVGHSHSYPHPHTLIV